MIFFFLFLLGSIFGSFLNAWIFRTHENLSIWRGRSHCRECKHVLLWRDMIPIVSFLFLKGRCRFCSAAIYIQYPMVELWMGIVFVFLGWWYEFGALSMIRDGFIIFFLTFVFVSDLRFMEIPMQATLLPAAALFLLFAAENPARIGHIIFSISIIAGFFLLQYLVSRGAWIGFGDVWLGVFMGVVLGNMGIEYALFGLLVSYLLGACIAGILVFFFKKTKKTRVSFGTFLAVGTAVIMYLGNPISSWYTGFLY